MSPAPLHGRRAVAVLLLCLLMLGAALADMCIPVVWFMDGNIDDFAAFAMLAKSRGPYCLKAISVDADGFARPAAASFHARRLLTHFNRTDVAVAQGQPGLTPAGNFVALPPFFRDATDVLRGAASLLDGLEPVPEHPDNLAMVAEVVSAPGPRAVFFTTGLLTDPVLFFRQYPHLRNRVAAVYTMGGAVDVDGNVQFIDPVNVGAEANIYLDAEAAREFFGLAGVNRILVSLKATNGGPFTPALMARLAALETLEGRLTYAMFEATRQLFGDQLFYTGIYPWDQVTAAVLFDPSLCFSYDNVVLTVLTDPADPAFFGSTVVVSDRPTGLFARRGTASCNSYDVPTFQDRFIASLA